MLIIYHVIIEEVKNVLFVNKPSGMTSFDVCFKLRKVLHTKKIGHTGTLDPLATGVMIVLFDKATKANPFLVSDRKTYRCEVVFGISTDTLDIDGKVIENSEYSLPQKEDLKAVLDGFLGESLQEVPITSAVSVDGKRLYQYQREGRQVDLPKRTIRVYSIELEKVLDDGFVFTCEVSSGTYIRALARDILKKLGLNGTVRKLERTAIDDITIEQCDDLEQILLGNFHTHTLYELLSKRYPVIRYSNPEEIRNGKKIVLNCNEKQVLICEGDEVLAVYEKEGDRYRCLRGLW